ncbi:thermonuclease family protein [Candidatus Mycobacterium methanotrophicum]|uniref:TNase-like domain-containing protein n=1 Tax=Candidatus Mycobacterium methanotrophicum TaxID=2943498 RepID=A0ABY4QUB0_9MYCO|nr:hypothetical protein [Candidatus Mycobacterium methanotrophicum]UQX13450.1 hypothetical protein M5I08_24920 [Candidatus Mycobacterium methanotrophicum]
MSRSNPGVGVALPGRYGWVAGMGLFIAAALLISGCGHSHAGPQQTNAVVVKVVDGDTVDVRSDERGRLRIRIIGIDTPETKKPRYTVGLRRLGSDRVRKIASLPTESQRSH